MISRNARGPACGRFSRTSQRAISRADVPKSLEEGTLSMRKLKLFVGWAKELPPQAIVCDQAESRLLIQEAIRLALVS
jgi:hypothetical protein